VFTALPSYAFRTTQNKRYFRTNEKREEGEGGKRGKKEEEKRI